ncbi:polysaccharide deacetylase family protein [Sanguibacteroides justesenii]|uniref:DUF7033 domain-containing protein n=1 Tax=Sanguibacteroides justesenii TaxID=1547597 RepID=A0A0C3RK09_9PORP|nr:polysaccharide deacetylase family protein [Sanguibacteroides justesenii]KIO46694.1 hypothetical protein BA92_02190 [Sanguibacteroides justesenii]
MQQDTLEYRNRECAYIIEVLSDFLGLSCEVKVGERYCITGKNGKLEINNVFWGTLGNEYLKKENIPAELKWLNTPFEGLRQLPIVYGVDELLLENNYVYCGLDIFSSAFFMLTRWEELFLPKDKFGRCDENEMFVVKYGIYNRPVVNEYIELLRELLTYIGVEVKKCDRKFHPFITHDVDDLFRYASYKNFCKNLTEDILHRKSLKTFLQSCYNYIRYRAGKIKDPFDTFDEVMDLSDQYGYKDAFYFMPSYRKEYDSRYDIRDKRIKRITDHIVKCGHEVGIHPSRNTFQCQEQFRKEMQRLNKICPEVKGGRQHYLLYSIPETFRTWDENGLAYDAGLGFTFRGGFRCGICYDYPFFDVLERRRLGLWVRPLIVMETALLRGGKEPESVREDIFGLVDTVRKYRGEFVFLWHTDNFNRVEYYKYRDLYFKTLKYVAHGEE